MGSGCNQNNINKANCPVKVSDKCVLYTGPAIPALGICTNDTLEEVEKVILDKLLEVADGQIELTEITANCDFVTQTLAGKDKNLSTLIQVLFDQNCTLHELIEEINNKPENPYPFDLKCLTTPSDPSRDEIVQALINLSCNLKDAVDNITNQLSTSDEDEPESLVDTVNDLIGNYLRNNITHCQNSIEKTGQGKNTKLNFIHGCPVGTLLFGNYDLSWFDNNGKGLKSASMCGWALADGRNGTWDMRGLSPIGATTGVPGGALLPNTTIPGDPNSGGFIGQVKGTPKVTLQVSNLPDHQHNISDPGHTHSYSSWPNNANIGQGGSSASSNKSEVGKTTASSQTGIQVTGVKAPVLNTPVENRHPVRYGVWIMRVYDTVTQVSDPFPPISPIGSL